MIQFRKQLIHFTHCHWDEMLDQTWFGTLSSNGEPWSLDGEWSEGRA